MLIVSVVTTVVLIVLDRVSKIWAVQTLMPVESMPMIPGIIEFRYVENNGAAFGLLAGRQSFLIVFTSIALLVVAFVLFLRRPKDKMETISLMLIFSGGVGNLIDRIATGYVVDYFNLLFMRFAVFNLADCYVCIGVGLLFIAFIRTELRERKESITAEDSGEESGVSYGKN